MIPLSTRLFSKAISASEWIAPDCYRSLIRRLSFRLLFTLLATPGLNLPAFGQLTSQTLNWKSPVLGRTLLLGKPQTLTASASSGLPVTFRVQRGPAIIAAGQVTATNVGTIVLVVEQTGDGVYASVSEARTFNQSSVEVAFLGEWPGRPRGVAHDAWVSGTNAYLATDSGVVILDITNPTRPSKVGGISTDKPVKGIEVVGTVAYLANEGSGLQILDVSDRSNPKPLGNFDTGGITIAVRVVDHFAYLADGHAGLLILDVSDPTHPTRVGGYDTTGEATAVHVVGGRAYVADNFAGLQIFDVTNPANPVRLGGIVTAGYAFDVATVGQFAYVAVGEAGLQIFDVSDAANPRSIGTQATAGYAWGIHVSGNVAYLAAGVAGVEAIDIRNPATPVPLASLNTGGDAFAVTLNGSVAYVVDGSGGLQAIDFSHPTKPTRLGVYESRGFATAVQIVGNIAYLADGDAGLRIVDVQDPARPVPLGSYDTAGYAFGVQVVGSLAYVADGAGGLQILDVSNPASPQNLGSVISGNGVLGVEVVGNLAYLAYATDGLEIIDVHDPVNPTWIGGYDTAGWVRAVRVVDHIAYVADQDFGLQIIDVSDPTHPSWLAAVPSASLTVGVEIVGKKAFMADLAGGLRVIDIRDPANPALIAVVDTGGDVQGVQIVDNVAYILDSSGLVLMDLTDLAHPVRLGHYGENAGLSSLQVVGNIGYAAEAAAGLQVLRLREGLAQSISFDLPKSIAVTNGPVTLMLSATASSGLPVSFKLVNGPAHLLGNQLTLTNAGSVVVRAETLDSPQFLPGSVERTVEATKVLQSLVFDPPAKVLLAARTLNLEATAGSGLSVTFTLLAGPGFLAGNKLTFTNVGSVVIRAEQPGNEVYQAAEGITRSIQVVDPVVILEQPSPKNGSPGSAVSFQVKAAGGEPLVFQWYRNGLKLAGANASALQYAAISTNETGLYQVVITNRFGSVTSRSVSLTVDLPGSELSLLPRGSVALRGASTRGNPARIELQGNYAFVTELALPALQIYDISDPDTIRLAASVPFLGASHEDSALANGYLLLAERRDGLGIVDVREPTQPVRLPRFQFPGNKSDVVTVRVQGGYAYIGNGTFGFSVLDISDPPHPKVVATVDTPGIAAGVFLRLGLAYVADWDSGLSVFAVNDPTAPVRSGRYPKTGFYGANAYDVVATDRAAYVVDAIAGFVTFDVRDLQDIKRTKAVSGSVWGLDVADRFAFLADNGSLVGANPTGGVRVFDLSLPHQPVSLGRLADWGTVDGVLLRGNRLWVAGARFGAVDMSFGSLAPVVTVHRNVWMTPTGEAAFLEAAATGSEPIAYQWYLNAQPIDGATNRTFRLPPVLEGETTDYSVEVRNASGRATSPAPALDLAQSLEWVLPTPNTPLRLGQSYPLSASASSGLPVRFQVLHGPAMISADNMVTVTNVGTVRLVAEQTGNSSFRAIARTNIYNVPSVQFTDRGSWPKVPNTPIQDIFIAGSQAYAAISVGGLAIFDISNPAKPVPVGHFETPGDAYAVKVVDSLAYIAADRAGLQVIDVSNPIRPVRLGSFPTQANVRDVEIRGHFAFIADGAEGLKVLDLSDPTRPVSIGAFSNGGMVLALQIVDEIAYLAAQEGGLQLVNISDPTHPTYMNMIGVGQRVEDVKIVGHLAYLVDSIFGLKIIDVTNPTNPLVIGSFADLPAMNRLSVRDNLAYLSGDGTSVHVLDISNPYHPVAVAVLDQIEPAQSVTLAGHLMYWGSALGFQVFDATNPKNPVLLGRDAPVRGVQAVQVFDQVAYLACHDSGLQMVKVGDPSNPILLGSVDSLGEVRDVDLVGTLAYVTDWLYGLHVIDVRDPQAPVRLGDDTMSGYVASRLVNNFAYVAGSATGLHILDVQDPTMPREIRRVMISSGVKGVDVAGNVAFVLANSLMLFDVSDPANPSLAGNIGISGGDPRSIEVVNQIAYVAAGGAGLQIFDVKNAGAPGLSGSLKTAGPANDIQVVDHLAYLADAEQGLEVVDISDPSRPISIGSFASIGTALGVQVVENLAYVANGFGGLRILELRRGQPQTLVFSLPNELSVADFPLTLNATVNSGLPVNYSVVSGPAFLKGNVLNLTGIGAVTLRAEQAGDLQFLPVAVETMFTAGTSPTLTLKSDPAGFRLSWPSALASYGVESAERLAAAGDWRPVTQPIEDEGGIRSVLVPDREQTQFYRLRRLAE